MLRSSGILLLRGALLVALATLLTACHDKNPMADTKVSRALAAIEGIPQDGFTLGRSDAPWTLSIISAATGYELDPMISQLPALTERFVRSGRMKLQLRTPTSGSYSGDGEERAAAGALLAAGLQGRYWDCLVTFVASYGDGLELDDLETLLTRSGVADVDRAMVERLSPRVRRALVRADAAAAATDGQGRVVYLLRPTNGPPRIIALGADTGRLAEAVARVLG